MERKRPSGLVVVAALAAAVPFGIHAWFAFHGYFAHDDFVFLHSAMNEPFDGGYLFQNHNGHVIPGVFALVWLVTKIAPLSFPVAMLPLLLMMAAAYVVLWRLLVRCFGARWGIVIPFAVVTCSPVIHTSTLWWAYALQFVPTLLAMVLAIDAHVRHVQTGRTGSLIAGVLWTAAGMAFYEKAALFGFLMLGFSVLLAPRRWPASLGWALRTHRWTWTAHGALLAGYAALYLALAGGQVRADDVDTAAIPELAGRMIVDSLLVPSLGLPVNPVPGDAAAQLVSSADVVRVIAVVALGALVAAGCVIGKQRAALAWTLFAGYLAADIALVALTRLPVFGALIGADLRYIGDAVLVLALCAAFAFLRPSQAAGEPVARAGGSAQKPSLVAVLAGVTALAMIGATITSVRLAPNMLFGASRDYLANARAAFAQRPEIVLYDSPVPSEVMIDWFGEERMASRVVSLLPQSPRFETPGEHMYLLDDRGRPREITGVAYAATGRPGPVADCGYPVTEKPTKIPLSEPVDGKRLLRIDYFTAAPGKALITAGRSAIDVDLEVGPHHMHVAVEGTFDSITVSRATPVAAVCVGQVAIGLPTT